MIPVQCGRDTWRQRSLPTMTTILEIDLHTCFHFFFDYFNRFHPILSAFCAGFIYKSSIVFHGWVTGYLAETITTKLKWSTGQTLPWPTVHFRPACPMLSLLSFHKTFQTIHCSIFGVLFQVNICFQKVAAEILGIKLTRPELEQQQRIVKAEISTYTSENAVRPVKPPARSGICNIQ